MPTDRHAALLHAASEWAGTDDRVRALLLKGSLARGDGDGDERSDLDLVIVTEPGGRAELWAERRRLAEQLGRCLGGFDEAAWQAPYTFIALYDGPVKVDFFYQDGEPYPDPWLRDGFVALFDPDGLADRLRISLGDEQPSRNLAEFDAHAWDWLWWMDVKLTRGKESWLVYVELVKFVETILLAGHNVLDSDPWRGASDVERRLSAGARAELLSSLPAAPRSDELRRALTAATTAYERLRERLAAEKGMRLLNDLADQVLAAITKR